MTFDDRIEPRGPRRRKKPLFLFDPFAAGNLERPMVKGMTLETEGGLRMETPPWGLVKSALERLDAGEGNSFAILSVHDKHFVQALSGANGFHLEWRITGDDLETYIHYRACVPEASTVRRFLKKQDGLNDGQQRDLLALDQVITAFRAFFDRKGPPKELAWRALDI